MADELFSRSQGVFMISVAARLAGMHPQTLRVYEARGLIKPARSPKQTRLYSQRDVERLRRIQELTTEFGMNLAGVERVLELEERWRRCAALRPCSARCSRGSTRSTAHTSGSSSAGSHRRTQRHSGETTMQADKFTIKSQEAIQAAQRLAHERGNPEITPEHLLAVLLEQDGGIVVPLLAKLGCAPDDVRPRVTAALDKLPSVAGAAASQSGPSGELVRVFQAAEREASALQDEFISTEHLLIALAESQGEAGAGACPIATRSSRRCARCAARTA